MKAILLIATLAFAASASAADLVCTMEKGAVFQNGTKAQDLPQGNYGTLTIQDYSTAKDKYTVVLTQPEREPATAELAVGTGNPIKTGNIQDKVLVWGGQGTTEDGAKVTQVGQMDIYLGGASFALAERAKREKDGQVATQTVFFEGSCQ